MPNISDKYLKIDVAQKFASKGSRKTLKLQYFKGIQMSIDISCWPHRSSTKICF